MKIKTFIGLWLIITSASAYAQDKDFGIWYGVDLKHDLTDKISLEASGSVRTWDNAGKIEQGFLEAGIGYELNKFFSVATSYRLSNSMEDDSEYHLNHKFMFDCKGTLPLADFTFSCRLRFQTRLNTFYEDEEDKLPDYTGRIRLKASYNIPSFPVNPYVYIEPFCPLFADNDRTIGKNRLCAGLQYNISKKQSVDLVYVHDHDYIPDDVIYNIVSLGYCLEF